MVDLNLREIGSDVSDSVTGFADDVRDFVEENPQLAILGAGVIGIGAFVLLRQRPKTQTGGIFPAETVSGDGQQVGGEFSDEVTEQFLNLQSEVTDALLGIEESNEQRFASIEAAQESSLSGFASVIADLESGFFGALQQQGQSFAGIQESVDRQLGSFSGEFYDALSGIANQSAQVAQMPAQLGFSTTPVQTAPAPNFQQASIVQRQPSQRITASVTNPIARNLTPRGLNNAVQGLFSNLARSQTRSKPAPTPAPRPTAPSSRSRQNLSTLVRQVSKNPISRVFSNIRVPTPRPTPTPAPRRVLPRPTPARQPVTRPPISFQKPAQSIGNFFRGISSQPRSNNRTIKRPSRSGALQ